MADYIAEGHDELAAAIQMSRQTMEDDNNRRIQEFVHLTDSSPVMATFFLQEQNWDVEKAVEDYFAQMAHMAAEDQNRQNNGPAPVAPLNVPPINVAATLTGKTFRHVTWNIFGMEVKGKNSKLSLPIRMNAICDILLNQDIAIVFLQEVSFDCMKIIRRKLDTTFHIYSGSNNKPHFTMTLVKKRSFFTYLDNDLLRFENTFKERNVLQVEVTDGERKYVLLNSHLESNQNDAFRMLQLNFLFDYFKILPNDVTVITAGDFNLRDEEVSAVGGLPANVFDAWEANGGRRAVEFTWDTARNDTFRKTGHWEPKRNNHMPRRRYDRVFIKPAEPKSIELTNFELIGTEKVNGWFPSDHFGVVTSYRFA